MTEAALKELPLNRKISEPSSNLLKIYIFAFLTFAALGAKSQWIADGPPIILEHEFVTAGGITYLRFVSFFPDLGCCEALSIGEVFRSGSNLVQVIQRKVWAGGCILMVCDPWREDAVSVLGVLPPGSYHLNLVTPSTWAFEEPAFTWAIWPFTVPTNSGFTLKYANDSGTNGLQPVIQVAGISNVRYVLESSSDLRNWTSIMTNAGAPSTFTLPISSASQVFYRASIHSDTWRARWSSH
ncbi:MAG: hypothetical protein JWM16_2569 [Verrucomicrobiales bacterium]|nr:hypothetical protein [Verrucomicrobiales bacterium]